jgi:hypothetical protein
MGGNDASVGLFSFLATISGESIALSNQEFLDMCCAGDQLQVETVS